MADNIYSTEDWYWSVGTHSGQFFSTAAMAYVDPADAAFRDWQSRGGVPTVIDREIDLGRFLDMHGVASPLHRDFVPYAPSAWYWIVGGDAARRYSSAAGAYVPATDPTYLAWYDDGAVPSVAANEAALDAVLTRAGLPGLSPGGKPAAPPA